MTRKTFAEAMVDGLRYCMEEDPHFSLIGNEVLGLGPEAAHLRSLAERFSDRIHYPPTSEAGFVALAAGAAMAGVRMFAHLGLASFSYPAMSSIANELATAHYTSGGKVKVPVVLHMGHGLLMGGASQHSASPQSMFWNVPGLEIALPATPYDVKGLLRTAVKSDNPTLLITHGLMMGTQGEVPDEDYAIPFGKADVKRKGRDVTVVATSLTVTLALEAAEALAKDGIEVEVIDPRTLVPFDKAAILASVAKTGRLVVADETNRSCGVASEIVAIVAEEGFASLKAPVVRVTRPDVPIPASAPLEAFLTPTAEKIAAAVRRACAKRG